MTCWMTECHTTDKESVDGHEYAHMLAPTNSDVHKILGYRVYHCEDTPLLTDTGDGETSESWLTNRLSYT